MRARLELIDVTCHNPEDRIDTDMIYLTGGLTVAGQPHPVALSPMGMRQGQVRPTWQDQSVLFDGELSADGALNLAVVAWDRDLAKSWGEYRVWLHKLREWLQAELAESTHSGSPSEGLNRETLDRMIEGAFWVVDELGARDDDDQLGAHRVTLRPDGQAIQVRSALFQGESFTGSWKYELRYRAAFPEVTPVGLVVRYGTSVRLMHEASTRVLSSGPRTYRHRLGSGQQAVTASELAPGASTWWFVKPAHGQAERRGEPVQHGDIIRLEHPRTGRNLHSHAGLSSPVTGQQEVTCFGSDGDGDGNDDWRVELDGGGAWEGHRKIRLVHVATGHALHSHHGHLVPDLAHQQEVTGFAGRDGNDHWRLLSLAEGRKGSSNGF